MTVTELGDGVEAVYHLYVVMVDDRDGVRERLGEQGIGPGSTTRCRCISAGYEALGYSPGDFPVAERRAGRILSLPMFPEIDHAQRDLRSLSAGAGTGLIGRSDAESEEGGG